MKYSFRKFAKLFFFGMLLLSQTVDAQIKLFGDQDLRKIQIETYSDEELINLYNQAKSSGLNDKDLYQLAAEKGMPNDQIALLKNRIETIRKRQTTRQTDDSTVKSSESRYDSSLSPPVKPISRNDSLFGSELFASTSLVFEPNLRIPPPPNYILGPDDELVISVYGYSEKKYNLRVNELGEIYIPNVGPIMVSGLSLEEAASRIRSKLAATIYRAINSGQTKVEVTLGKIRSIRVTVIGEARRPGTYTVSSLTTLFNILYLAGGPSDMGSYRRIEIIRGNQTKKTADLYDFLVYGNQKHNVLLQEGDVVRIPYYQNRVTLSGMVKRPGIFEMLTGETFADLMVYSGGFTDLAYRGAVTVERISDSQRLIVDLPSSDFNTFSVKGSDKFIVGRIQEEFGNRIYVTGAIQRPGPYQTSEGLTVTDLLTKAGGLTPDAYKKRAIIYRYYDNMMPAIVSVSLDSVLNYGQKVYLQKNDSLVVSSIFEFRDKDNISVEGYVRKPGPVVWRDHIKLADVLIAVGGVTDIGDSTTIEVARRVQNADIRRTNHQETHVFTLDLTTDRGRGFYLQPFDVVIVKSKPGYTVQRSVMVNGEVKSPGKYALENSASTVADVIRRSGGFKASADSTSLTIRRINSSSLTQDERERLFQRVLNVSMDSIAKNPSLQNELYRSYNLISVNLKTALEDPNSSENLRLEDGDILTVMRNTNLVKISGEVYYPTVVPYKAGKNLKYYVEQAGNFMPNARKAGALVINPDGKVASVKRFLFFKSYPDVSPRSEIFVPQKMKQNRNRITTGEWALIVSALGILANVLLNTK